MTTPRSDSVAQRINGDELFFDSAIVSHGFAAFLRDYDVIIEVSATKPDGTGNYVEGRYRYRFTHCVEAIARTTVTPESWQTSWDELFTDRRAWEHAGSPDGYVWAVEWAEAGPGMSYVENSQRVQHWTELLAHEMHEVRIESNALDLTLVFHDLRIDQLAVGDPITGTLNHFAQTHD
jgi:hypothetical protein